MSGDPYVIPGTTVLRNKFGISDAEELDRWERRRVLERFSEGAPTGKFDLAHLRAIHRHLFQDVYDWAGEIRTLEISKGGTTFMFRRFIEGGMADVHRRLSEWRFLKGLDAAGFAAKAGEIIGDINHIHPFREGNGRTQMTYLVQLGDAAGHEIDVSRIERDIWYAASRAANRGDYSPMAAAIWQAIV
jgi:cell filamentation protein